MTTSKECLEQRVVKGAGWYHDLSHDENVPLDDMTYGRDFVCKCIGTAREAEAVPNLRGTRNP